VGFVRIDPMIEERKVRSADGLIPWHSDEEHGCTIQEIKEWRAAQHAAGSPSTLEEFYAAHGLCLDCGATGAQMVGWSDPVTEIDIKAADELGLSQLPLYEVCQTCGGTGKAEKSRWVQKVPL
jgi:hypothetical protein